MTMREIERIVMFSPHAWGWSAERALLGSILLVLPTRVGMVRLVLSGACRRACSPHTRGDGPRRLARWVLNDLFSPHAWGWSANYRGRQHQSRVLPTRVGMVRENEQDRMEILRSPHTRGDGPSPRPARWPHPAFSPHAWGWSVPQVASRRTRVVLPTRVGMVRSTCTSSPVGIRSPHTRGDGPFPTLECWGVKSFSPHAWGWSAARSAARASAPVLPTRVGMVRRCSARRCARLCSPHTRGDGPIAAAVTSVPAEFSPHAWGWSGAMNRSTEATHVLPTRVGMVRMCGLSLDAGVCSPHTRGDGPVGLVGRVVCRQFSPHAWGWSDISPMGL